MKATLAVLILFATACSGDDDTRGASGDFCGGIAGERCAEGYLCKFEEGLCRQPDASGICQRRPEVCPEIFQPVCGCDGKDYSNECHANASGVSVLNGGQCAPGA